MQETDAGRKRDGKKGPDRIFAANEKNRKIERTAPGTGQRSLHNIARGEVAAHSVNSDRDHVGGRFFDPRSLPDQAFGVMIERPL